MKKIKMILHAKDNLPSKDSLQKISEKKKLDLPAYFGENLINYNSNEYLCFSPYESIITENNLDELINCDPGDYNSEFINACINVKKDNLETNIFLIPFDMDGRPPNLYKI